MFDASILSDEATAPGLPNFTGAFVGMACQDLAGTARPADFDYFEYRERRVPHGSRVGPRRQASPVRLAALKFSATDRSRWMSRALYTAPIPPSPIPP